MYVHHLNIISLSYDTFLCQPKNGRATAHPADIANNEITVKPRVYVFLTIFCRIWQLHFLEFCGIIGLPKDVKVKEELSV